MPDSNLIPFKVKRSFNLYNKTFEEGKEFQLQFLEVEVLINEGLVDIVPLNAVYYRKMFKEEKESEKVLELDQYFFDYVRISQKYLKDRSNISDSDKKIYNDSASALRNFLIIRAEKILRGLLIENQKIEVHEEELTFISIMGEYISKWIKFRESLIKGEKYEA
ncbi:MAG: hypothetical protein APG12_01373 [Candidatus Methanofastidiosum methylothiophilum]|uniref:GINS subunit domain-containing protein n=1 Tax=Candidatus Methanofastidiosum methylothiophilum TaxID=1705564 RepID=A0A150IX99_9EURY|nr:MAG: hypothetical protein APG10_01091 [Candidatus Methanofastidiosum methylthiophilus]KYC47415.1 MAG: hypothetical protein APG11_01186 [Candidatus Methanofastidiosum methylthiophilus]KYC49599.1 MAG: hypothetical protein APG12_01373 [Candidatus Methanofastidiosum methylthiophilus]